MNTTQTTTKKAWSKPQLLVLVRSNPEEAVLGACKGGAQSGSSQSDQNCYWDPGGGCLQCNSLAAS